MVLAIVASNKKHQQQCKGTPFHLSPLVNKFGYLAEKICRASYGRNV